MFCRKCGSANDENAFRCVSCGQVLDRAVAAMQPGQSIPNYLAHAIIVTVLCCLPLGIPAIVFAAQVNGKIALGDIPGALESSQKAKMFCWISFGLGVAANAVIVGLWMVGALYGDAPVTRHGARIIGYAVLGGAFLVFLTLLYVNDPASTRWFPACPIYQLSGLHCPGCGSMRAAHRLLHADIAGALSMNPLMVVMLPVIALLIGHRTLKYKRWVPWTALAVLMVYGIARNIPAWPCTLLAPG